MTPERYRNLLLEPLAGLAPRAAPMPPVAPSVWFKPDRDVPEKSLRDLFVSGVLCGHVETREHLARHVDAFDARFDLLTGETAIAVQELAMARRDLADTRRMHAENMRRLEEAMEAARARARELEESTFWRLTYPLRIAIHGVKAALRNARGFARQVRLATPRLAIARQIAKDQGVLELLRRFRAKVRRRQVVMGLRVRAGLASGIERLAIPVSDAPRVSVVIPTYGQDLHTFTCLRALALEAARVPLEVIVMDDCAPEPAAEALDLVTGVRFERNDTNLGFVRNCNRGAKLARGEYLLFLNNDAVLGAGAVEALLGVFERDPLAGAAGAKLVYPDGRLQEAGGIVWRDGSAWNYGRGDDPEKPDYNYVREADYCSAACLLVPAALFHSLGGFDERYAPAYCEDTDFCFKVREAGRKVVYQPAAEVVHFEGVSNGTDIGQGVKRHQVENQARFHEKWKPMLSNHRVNGVLPMLERDRGARHRVLVVEACMLTPDQDSGSMRTWRLLKVMQEEGCKVTFVAENLQQLEPYARDLQQMGIEVLYAPFVTSIEALIEERGAEFDVVVLARYYVASRYIDAVRRNAPKALLVLDTLDLHYLRQRRLAALEGSHALAQSAQAIYGQEIECVRRCDVTWVVSEVEREILVREVPRATVMVQTNIHYALGSGLPWSEREGIVFVGGYRHPPNVDAAIHFARDIAPHLRELLPGVTTRIIGSNAPRAVLDLDVEGVEVVGYVAELEPWLDRSRVSISPLRYGAGVKGKINHAMSHGLPVVATTPSVEGMHLVVGEEILVADEPRAFAEAVARLYRDEALWNRLSQGGLENVTRHFSPEVAGRALRALLEAAQRKRAG
jgi:GT2 family glycosyltransferase